MPGPNAEDREGKRGQAGTLWPRRLAARLNGWLRPFHAVAHAMRRAEGSLGFFGRWLRRLRQTVLIPALCAVPLYVVVAVGSVSGDDVRSLLEIVELEGTSAPPQTIVYSIDPTAGTARAVAQCEDEYIARQFTRSVYGDNVIIVNVFGEKVAPLLRAAEWFLNIFFNVKLPAAVQTYLDVIRGPEFAKNKIGNVTEYVMDRRTNVSLYKEILAEHSFLEACAEWIVRAVGSGGYVCPLTRVVVTDTAVMGAGFADRCLITEGDTEPRLRPTAPAAFWTRVKTSLGVLQVR